MMGAKDKMMLLKTGGASRSETDRERDGGCGRQLIRPRQMNKGPDCVEGMRRKRRWCLSRHQLLFQDRSQRRHSQQRHLQNPMGYHVVTPWPGVYGARDCKIQQVSIRGLTDVNGSILNALQNMVYHNSS
ncbi:hypothetical protein DPMN_126067 [Dreissena polymorpha]|uniref:Uncharacterized protein n=1 Tax=Dreissena polymorpha TaxID=45954 RepID=A0A9D4GZG4_DREPO|nr:hypothetical protein DPMN_126067 [Dreissena polymorpha]